MRRVSAILIALAASIAIRATEGALNGKFTINAEGDQVVFSRGNLQYQASTEMWRFAEHQYDYIGEANTDISDTDDGWIDLFGWGTGNKPTTKSIGNSGDYQSFTDWGVNPISNGDAQAGLWRTLSKKEWVYLFQTRHNASVLFGMGSVNGVNGMILLPDDWSTPAGITFTPSTQQGLQDLGIHFDNQTKNNFSHNTYTSEQWIVMEYAGAVFLPAAGGRFGNEVYEVGLNGCYWSATIDEYCEYFAHLLYFDSQNLFPQGYTGCYRGLSVRLVKSIEAEETEGIDNVQSDNVQCTKVLRDGVLIIEKNGKFYNATGAEVK